MSDDKMITEARPIQDVDRVVIRVDNVVSEVLVKQGDRETFSITGPEDLLGQLSTPVRNGRLQVSLAGSWAQRLRSALSTSLTRQWVRYELTLRELRELELCGFAHASVPKLSGDQFSLRLWGGGQASVGTLSVESFDVSLRGSTTVYAAGRVARQKVTLEGMAQYTAERLQSETAAVRLRGWGKATVWATETLRVSTHGMGVVQYYGSPRVYGSGSPMGQVVRLGDAPYSTAVAA